MKMFTRFVSLFCSVAVAFGLSLASAVAEYPERAVTMVVGSVPGSGPDVLARSMAVELGDEFGHPVVVENMPGAAGNVAAAAVSRSAPDGYEIFIGTINMAIATWLPEGTALRSCNGFRHCRTRCINSKCNRDHAGIGAKDD